MSAGADRALTGRPALRPAAPRRHITRADVHAISGHFCLLLLACASEPTRAQDAAAPFDGDLQRLAEIFGGLHYLRGICGSNEGNKWRNEMQALIDAETPCGRAPHPHDRGLQPRL